ncbi:MAG: hypothetical protein ABI585_02120 [Betaproteobacteria bacterium]
MRAALAAQKEARIDEAIAAYDAILLDAPQTIDAWHMRGVAHFQADRFDAAEADIVHALSLFPGLPNARRNLALITVGRRNFNDEQLLDRTVMRRFLPLVVDPPEAPLDGLVPESRLLIVDLGAPRPSLIEDLASAALDRGAVVRRMTIGTDGRLPGEDSGELSAAGVDDLIVCAGSAFPPGDWTLACRPRAIALVVDRATFGAIQDRLREVSGEGRRRVRLAVADRDCEPLPLPHWTLAA